MMQGLGAGKAADLTYWESAARMIAEVSKSDKIVSSAPNCSYACDRRKNQLYKAWPTHGWPSPAVLMWDES